MKNYFMEISEVEKLGQKKMAEQKTARGGIDLLSDGVHKVMAVGEDNVLVVGPTGAGKTRCLSIPLTMNLIDAGESYIAIDAKNTTVLHTYNKAKENGYHTFVLNLRQPSLSTDNWNPLTCLQAAYKSGNLRAKDEAMQMVQDMALCLFDDKISEDKFWPSSARGLFNGVCEALFMCGSIEQVSLYSMYALIVDGDQRIGGSNYLKTFYESVVGKDTEAYQSASGFLHAAFETRGSILATYLDGMKLFSNYMIKDLLCNDGFHIDEIKDDEKWAIYIILPDESRKYHQIGVIFLKLLYNHLVRMAENNDGRNNMRWNFILEEMGTYTIPEVDAMFSAVRSRNARIFAFLQTLEQLEYRYSKEQASTIKNNCALQYYFATNNLHTLTELEMLCGKKREIGPKGYPMEQPLLSISDLQGLPRRNVLVRYRGNVYITYFPDWSECYHKDYGQVKFEERTPKEVEKFDIVKVVRRRNDELDKTFSQEEPDVLTNFYNPETNRRKHIDPIRITSKEDTNIFQPVGEMTSEENTGAVSSEENDKTISDITKRLKEIDEEEMQEIARQLKAGDKVTSKRYGHGKVVRTERNPEGKYTALINFSGFSAVKYPEDFEPDDLEVDV